MRAEDCAAERAEIVGWSTPLIGDRLGEAYRACIPDEQIVRHLTVQHRRLWTLIVGGEPAKAAEARSLLLSLARMCRLSNEAIEAIDDIVLDELAEVVALRYRGSRAKTRSYNRILMDAASALTRVRLAAA